MKMLPCNMGNTLAQTKLGPPFVGALGLPLSQGLGRARGEDRLGKSVDAGHPPISREDATTESLGRGICACLRVTEASGQLT